MLKDAGLKDIHLARIFKLQKQCEKCRFRVLLSRSVN